MREWNPEKKRLDDMFFSWLKKSNLYCSDDKAEADVYCSKEAPSLVSSSCSHCWICAVSAGFCSSRSRNVSWYKRSECSASCPTRTHAEPIRFASSSRRILVGAAKMWRQWLLSSLGRDVSMRNEKLRRHTCPSHSTLHHRNTFGRSDVNGTLILLISH